MSKVMVGMSGGVDSSAAALLLKEQGYEVIGVTLRMFGEQDIVDTDRRCGALDDVRDAKAVAEKLGFEHRTLDFSQCFRENVMRRFSADYLAGRTPNPCVECNRYVKFGEMLRQALEMGCDYVATGHYASKEFDEKSGRWLMKRPSDRSKDQTYVLYSLTQEQLEHILFPLSGMEKAQVRKMAEEHGLVNSEKPDSQDICFVPDGNYAEFIRLFSRVRVTEGRFLDMEGNVLGTHKGIINYTIGQRKGLGIALGKPAYVVRKDMEQNAVIIGEESDLYSDHLIAEDVNLISVADIAEPMRITAKTRYTQHEQPAMLSKLPDGRFRVDFDQPQRAITSGQAVVFYDGDVVVGGGTII